MTKMDIPSMSVEMDSSSSFMGAGSGAGPSNSFAKLNSAKPPRAMAPRMMMGSGNKSHLGKTTINMSDMSSRAKMRFDRSKVAMKASADDNQEFTITKSGEMNMKSNHMDRKFNQ